MVALINLLPWRSQRRQRKLRLLGLTTLLGMLLVTTLAAWHTQLVKLEVGLLRTQASSMALQEQTLQVLLQSRQRALKDSQQLRERLRVAEAVRVNISRWEKVLNALAAGLPENSWLRGLSWRNNKAAVQGVAMDFGELGRFEASLAVLPGNFTIKPGELRDEQNKGVSFSFILEPPGEGEASERLP